MNSHGGNKRVEGTGTHAQIIPAASQTSIAYGWGIDKKRIDSECEPLKINSQNEFTTHNSDEDNSKFVGRSIPDKVSVDREVDNVTRGY